MQISVVYNSLRCLSASPKPLPHSLTLVLASAHTPQSFSILSPPIAPPAPHQKKRKRAKATTTAAVSSETADTTDTADSATNTDVDNVSTASSISLDSISPETRSLEPRYNGTGMDESDDPVEERTLTAAGVFTGGGLLAGDDMWAQSGDLVGGGAGGLQAGKVGGVGERTDQGVDEVGGASSSGVDYSTDSKYSVDDEDEGIKP